MEVSTVKSRSERAGFLQFPWKVCAVDPVWLPPLPVERGESIDPKKHPFLLEAAALWLLVSWRNLGAAALRRGWCTRSSKMR